jgi:microcystin-dependent protein
MSHTTPKYALPYPDEADTADVPRDVQALATRIEAVLPGVGVPTGGGIDWYSTVAPAGFLLCDGSAVSRTTYAALFAAIGSAWGGGDGINTFNLPDTRGRVVVGYAAGGHADVNALALNDGQPLPSRRPKHNHTSALAIPNHAHAVNDPGHVHNFAGYGPASVAVSGGVDQGYVPLAGSGPVAAMVLNGPTGLTVGNPTSLPAIPGTIGASGAVDCPSYVVVAKAIKT